jgi:hypothetical protein
MRRGTHLLVPAGRWLQRSVCVVALLSASCATYVAGQAESVLLEAMPRVFGPADRYEARVVGANASASHFDKVRVVGVRVQRPNTPVIDRMEVDLQDVSVDRPNKRVTRIGAAQAVARITAVDLQSYLERQSWIAQPQVRLSPPDGVAVSGFLRAPGLGIAPELPASFSGRLLPSGSQLRVAVDALSLGNKEAPSLLRSLVGTVVNPVFDLSAYAVPSSIDRVVVQDDTIELRASGSHLQVDRAR